MLKVIMNLDCMKREKVKRKEKGVGMRVIDKYTDW